MKIGIISDTHDNVEMTKKACEIFKAHQVESVIHCGDLTSINIIKLFRDFKCWFVMGNADKDFSKINKECEHFGFQCFEESGEFDLNGKKIFILHGNVVSIFRDAVNSGKYNYIIKGHTHYFENYVRNNVRVINPGSLSGSDECTIAILNLDADEIEKIILAS